MTAIIGGFKGKTLTSLGKVTVDPGKGASLPVPQDLVIKEFHFVLNGYMSCTFGGTKPTVNPYGIFHGLIDELSLSRKGGTDRTCSFQGARQMIYGNERIFGDRDHTIYKVNSTDLTGTVVQGLPVWGTTGQNVALRESLSLPMENKLSGDWYPTLFTTQNLQTCKLNFKFNQLASVQDPEDANAGTYAGTMEIEVFAVCADHLMGAQELNQVDWVRTYEEKDFSGVQNGNKHLINPQGMLQGVLVTGLHSAGKPFDFENMKKTRIEFRYMGILIAEGSMADYLEIDASKTHLASRRKGSCYISFLNNRAFDSGLFIAEGKNIEITVSTDSTLSYSPNPVKLRFEYDQIFFMPTATPKVG